MSVIVNPSILSGGGGASLPEAISDFDFWIDSFQNVYESTGPDDDAEDADSVVSWVDRGSNARRFTVTNSTYESSGSFPYLIAAAAADHITITNPLDNPCSFFLVLETTDGDEAVAGGDNSGEVMFLQNGNGTGIPAAFGTVTVNGRTCSDRDDLHDFVSPAGVPVVICCVGADFSAFTDLTIGDRQDAASGFNFSGDIYGALGYTGTVSDANVKSLRDYLAEYYGFGIVSLLLHCDGSDESTTFTDSSLSAHTGTAFNQAQLDTSEKKFGTASGLFDGNADYVTFPTHSDFDLGIGDFTIECWGYMDSAGDNSWNCVLRRGGSSFGAGDYQFDWHADGRVAFQGQTLGNIASATGIVTEDTWHHVAVTREGTGVTIWADGVSVKTGTTSESFTSVDSMNIGRQGSNNANNWTGWLDEIRITKGIARYSASFTPEGPFTDPS